jgi:Family of unknown function (DUF6011)
MTLFGTKAPKAPRCLVCRRILKSASSIAAGVGPVCAGKLPAGGGSLRTIGEELEAAAAAEDPTQAIAA